MYNANDDAEEIKALLAKMVSLANARDVDGLMALHDDGETVFLFGERTGKEGNRLHCSQGYAALRGAFSYQFHPAAIKVTSGIGIVVGEEVISGTTENGTFSSTINATYCLKKSSLGWLIIHQHLSVQTTKTSK